MQIPLTTPDFRFRRLRKTTALRELVRETHVRMSDVILPIFVEEGIDVPVPIKSMPDVYRYPGLLCHLLFGVHQQHCTQKNRQKTDNKQRGE